MQTRYQQAEGTLIKFPTRDGLLLEGFLTGSRRSKVCMIYVHGLGGNFYRGTLSFALAQKLNGKGIAVFAINTRGHDLTTRISRTSKTKFSITIGAAFEKFENCVLDIDGAHKFLRSLGFKNFLLAGGSTGCQKITYYQYKKRSKDTIGLVLLGPADDYNDQKAELGKRFKVVVKQAKNLVSRKQGSIISKDTTPLSAKRFLSVADPKNIEARLFNYDGNLHEFSKIRVPICVIFGSKDEHATKSVKTYMQILRRKTNSRLFTYKIIKGAKHIFTDQEVEMVAAEVSRFVSKVT